MPLFSPYLVSVNYPIPNPLSSEGQNGLLVLSLGGEIPTPTYCKQRLIFDLFSTAALRHVKSISLNSTAADRAWGFTSPDLTGAISTVLVSAPPKTLITPICAARTPA